MSLFHFRRSSRVRTSRASRALRPFVNGFEPRLLLSGATIQGTVRQDLTGNGYSADDVPLAGVKLDLYNTGGSTVLASTTSAAGGTYSFKNLPAGNYTVKQVVPSGDVATQDIDGHVFTLAAGATASGEDFDDFKLLPQPAMSHLSFIVTTPAGKSESVTNLRGNVQQGDTVTARFTLGTAEPITLVAYTAPTNTWNTANLESQRIFTQASTSGGTGTDTLTVKIPDGYFQVDFVSGQAISVFDPNSNITYGDQQRLLDGDKGGTQPDPDLTIAQGDPGAANATAGPIGVVPAAVSLMVLPDGNTLGRKH